ncbi:uncharacterized protein N7477_010151 [Penicillium maclennaniae]|uniref:uncharacterized protein n=1 Tax=Penicillium maclennaniae TaxID=1343394 RepID=UPI0025422E55|nr:uncharacterized protein N7477_010151 [Penicillium maclennaniae]KAJ5662535.1 hypothetical protein N7477_010151 [Penicillium maclennaniae]
MLEKSVSGLDPPGGHPPPDHPFGEHPLRNWSVNRSFQAPSRKPAEFRRSQKLSLPLNRREEPITDFISNRGISPKLPEYRIKPMWARDRKNGLRSLAKTSAL